MSLLSRLGADLGLLTGHGHYCQIEAAKTGMGSALITPFNVDPRFQDMIDLLGKLPALDFLQDYE